MNIQEELNTLKQQLQESRNVAYQAMNYSSDLGTIVLFIEESFSITNDAELVENLLGVLAGMELEAVATVYMHEETRRLSRNEEITSAEAEIIGATRWEHRIASIESTTVFNYDHISCLVRNMPVYDEERYGMLKDTVATLLNGVESRLKVIEKDQRIVNTQGALLELTENTVAEFQSQFSQISSDATKIMGHLMNDMCGIVTELGVPTRQEQEVLNLINSHVGLIAKIAARCASVEENFEALKTSIDKILDECEVEQDAPPPLRPASFDKDTGSIELF